jgi:hypothetical protein
MIYIDIYISFGNSTRTLSVSSPDKHCPIFKVFERVSESIDAGCVNRMFLFYPSKKKKGKETRRVNHSLKSKILNISKKLNDERKITG